MSARSVAWIVAFLCGGTLVFPTSHGRAVEGEVGPRIYHQLLSSVVWIYSAQPGGKGASGTGALIDGRRRFVLTNEHVVGEARRLYVMFPTYVPGANGRPELVKERTNYFALLRQGRCQHGKVLVKDPEHDLALVELDGLPAGARAVALAAEEADPGQRVHSIGNPGAVDALWVYTSGTVRAVYHKRWKVRGLDGGMRDLNADVVETQSPTNPGDSGGPLVNDRCELVGVTHGTAVGAQLVSTFISVRDVRELFRMHHLALPLSAPAYANFPRPITAPTATPEPSVEEHADDARGQVEREAAHKLKYAKMLARDGLLEKARLRYQEIIEAFPDTKAAAEARELLQKATEAGHR